MTEVCMYCGDAVTDAHLRLGVVVKTIHGLYAHTGCIDRQRKESTMTEKTHRILESVQGVHQAIDLSISQLQWALGRIGEILTFGCSDLGIASLGSTMRLGQCIKEARFLLEDMGTDAVGLSVLLGKDLGVCESEDADLDDRGCEGEGQRPLWYKSSRALGDDLEPGEDEFDDDEVPF